MAQQMTFAEIGTLYNTISNELEGGVTHHNQELLIEQVSFLLTPPTPFPDSGVQTTTLLQFIADSNSLAGRAQALAGTDPNSAAVLQLEADIHTFSVNADAYSTAQGGLFSARFNNEFNLDGVQGTASRQLITGLQTGNADLVNGAASVLMANGADVRGNMLATGDTFTPAPNGGIPTFIDTVHDAGLVFDDAMTKLVVGVYSGNQTSIVNDLNATKTGLENTITDQGLTGQALHDIQHVISLLGRESSLVAGINTASPTQLSSVNGHIGQIEAQILNIVNHDATLAAMAVGAS